MPSVPKIGKGPVHGRTERFRETVFAQIYFFCCRNMGGIFSQEISSEEEVIKIQDSLVLTPSQRLQNPRLRDVRLLSVDPRSPSDFISRTPIVVEKTPELQAKKMKPSCDARGTLIQGPVIKDPRSPTTEFTRTPINPCLSSSGICLFFFSFNFSELFLFLYLCFYFCPLHLFHSFISPVLYHSL